MKMYFTGLSYVEVQRLKKRRENGQKRSKREAEARAKGTHTEAEWQELMAAFDYRCARCLRREPEIVLQKDHIFHLYFGGCDCIVNIQPLCSTCNAAKGSEHWIYRHEALEIIKNLHA